MKAIFTKYHGPTNYKGARISASDSDGNRVTISYPYELSGEAVHRKAADALCAKMGWTGELIAGGTKTGYVFVWSPNSTRDDGRPDLDHDADCTYRMGHGIECSCLKDYRTS